MAALDTRTTTLGLIACCALGALAAAPDIRAAVQRYWERFIGASGPDDASADAISPLRHVDAIAVPVLLVHGKDDTVVPFEQTQVMYDALKGAHKDVQLLPLAGEDHWLSRSETRLEMLKTSVAFLREHNPPD